MVKLADALERGRMREFEPGGGKMRKPLTAKSLKSYVSAGAAEAAAEGLNALGELEMTARQMAAALRLLAEERQSTQRVSDRIQLVWSGPQVSGASARETSVLARELFRAAKESVLVVSYVLDAGDKIDKLLGPLKENVANNPDLDVKIMVNVPRGYKDTRTAAVILAKFAKDFRTRVWPEAGAPKVYYDPRALEPSGGPRACLHAKCIVVDRECALVTSANFTEAAHARNIEAGVYVTDQRTASDLRKRFESLVDGGDLLLVPGLEVEEKPAAGE
jgi:phosphatidylserine/phosphatidylglycerophosphate/cardiolipin synthase-like enzyme